MRASRRAAPQGLNFTMFPRCEAARTEGPGALSGRREVCRRGPAGGRAGGYEEGYGLRLTVRKVWRRAGVAYGAGYENLRFVTLARCLRWRPSERGVCGTGEGRAPASWWWSPTTTRR